MEQAEEESATDDEVVQPVDLREDQAAYLMGDRGEDSQLLSPTTASPKSVLSASDTDVPTNPQADRRHRGQDGPSPYLEGAAAPTQNPAHL